MFTIPDAAVGPIAAATITGLITLLGLTISKENKTSEFREAWISALRSELAALIAHINNMQTCLAKGMDWKDRQPDFLSANKALMSIRLRLNEKEQRSVDLLRLLGEYEKLFSADKVPSPEDVTHVHHRLLPAARALLKSEWDRVRRGELTYRVAKITSIVVLVAGAAALGAAWMT